MIQVPGCRILIRPLKEEETNETAKRLKALGFELTENDRIREIKELCTKIYRSTNMRY